MTRPVLAIHGVKNRDKEFFSRQVNAMADAVGGDLKWIPVFWGDLGAKSAYLDRVTPPVWDLAEEAVDQIDPRAVENLLGPRRTGNEAPAVDNVDIVVAAAHRQLPPNEAAGSGQLGAAIREAWRQTQYLQRVGDERMLADVGRLVGEAVRDRASETSEIPFVGDVGDFVRRLFDPLDDLIAAASGRVVGAAHQFLRGAFIADVALFLGDIFVYQRNRAAIQQRIWEAIESDPLSRGRGDSPDNPIPVVAHSLGGVIAFDAASVSEPALHIDSLVTFGSQPAFFHLVDPRGGADSTTLPPYAGGEPVLAPTIRRWINLYEPLDPLAFLAGKVLRVEAPAEISDRIVEHRPEGGLFTHGDYWTHEEVMASIREALDVSE